MKKFKKILEEGDPKKIKKFVQKKMDKIDELKEEVRSLSKYNWVLEQYSYDLENELGLNENNDLDPDENREENDLNSDTEGCCKGNHDCCKKD